MIGIESDLTLLSKVNDLKLLFIGVFLSLTSDPNSRENIFPKMDFDPNQI